MAITSDVLYDPRPFKPESVDPSTAKLNNALSLRAQGDIKWWDVGAAKYRDLRATGGTKAGPPVILPHGAAKSFLCPSVKGTGNRVIPCRVFNPRGIVSPKFIFYHIHGGGWVYGSSSSQDLLLAHIADKAECTVVSVDYRLAPENPYPAGQEDCIDFVQWLLDNGKQEFGCELKFVGGESAGANLLAYVLFYLRAIGQIDRIKGAVFNFGIFDVSLLPGVRLGPEDAPLLTNTDMVKFGDAYLPNHSPEQRKSGTISPLYNNLKGLCPALFIVGTDDILLDDTILMHFKWSRDGNDARVRFFPGAPHGFMGFDGNNKDTPVVGEGWKTMIDYVRFQAYGTLPAPVPLPNIDINNPNTNKSVSKQNENRSLARRFFSGIYSVASSPRTYRLIFLLISTLLAYNYDGGRISQARKKAIIYAALLVAFFQVKR